MRDPTRLNSVLDLVFDNADSINDIEMEVRGGMSDHNTLIIKTNMRVNMKNRGPNKYLYSSNIQNMI